MLYLSTIYIALDLNIGTPDISPDFIDNFFLMLEVKLWIFFFLTFFQVQTIKQGYLLKRCSSLRADWKRRFFVLDSLGNLYYYRIKGAQMVLLIIFTFLH